MIIPKVSEVSYGRVLSTALQRLALYKNVEFATGRIVELHNVAPKYHSHVKNQARELRACLVQADEYFAAAKSASLATRPVLLYYGLMSYALGQILYKGTGNERLARLREAHSAHGLSLSQTGDLSTKVGVKTVATNLRVKPQIRAGGDRYGTFEMWRRCFRNMPVPGIHESIDTVRGGKSSGARVIFFSDDIEPIPTPKDGYSLEDAVSVLPQIASTCDSLGLPHSTLRATVSQETREAENITKYRVIIHPEELGKLEKLYDRFKFSSNMYTAINVKELKSGLIMELSLGPNDVGAQIHCPEAIAFDSEMVHLVNSDWAIGEFGAFYVSLSILGNLVRYFPDIWMAHVESSSEFSLLVNAICESAFERVPVLSVSELDRSLYIEGK